MQKTVRGIVKSFKADQISLEDAREELQGLKKSALSQRDASKQKFSSSSSSSESSTYLPRIGESVRVLTMKGAQALVQSWPSYVCHVYNNQHYQGGFPAVVKCCVEFR